MDIKIKSIMNKNGIDLFEAVDFKDCEAANSRLYNECKSMNTVIIFAIPYKTSNTPDDTMNMSEYARIYDYHYYFKCLFSNLIKDFESEFPSYVFKGFSDHSPINEKKAASVANLGVIGKNTLLITEKYGSYVFLGSIITDLEVYTEKHDIVNCINCGKCIEACPTGALTKNGFDGEKCISGISQKKIISKEEEKEIIVNRAVWGCDVCQKVCPMNQTIAVTDDAYFADGYIKKISSDFINNLTDEEFNKYPFSWRKKNVVLRNLELIENTVQIPKNHTDCMC